MALLCSRINAFFFFLLFLSLPLSLPTPPPSERDRQSDLYRRRRMLKAHGTRRQVPCPCYHSSG